MTDNVLSVRQLNLYVRSLIEGDPRLINVAVTGEISNFKNHYSSGHWYFTLKDNDAAIRCVMFCTNASRVKFAPEDGVQVILKGRVSIYEKDGQYQFYAEEMTASGLGDIALMFEQTKARLAAEGLLDADSKRPISEFPKKIAVITSPTGAAVRDIFNILNRRWPICETELYPVSVQGELAVGEMISALDAVYSKSDADVIIIGRGGGSIEDLWCFNDESLARKIYESPIPVISAVGHETDFTICDFVADLRAPTPSAAAELAVPDYKEIYSILSKYENIIKNSLVSNLRFKNLKLANIENSSLFKNPTEFLLNNRYLELDSLNDSLKENLKNRITNADKEFGGLCIKLDALSPLKVLSRGFAALSQEGKVVDTVKSLKISDRVTVTLSDGSVTCVVEEIKENNNG